MNRVEQELKTRDLGDQRLNERAIKVLERVTENPSGSLPKACSGWAELQATYRFFQNEKTGWEELLSPHWHSTNERIRQEPVVLAIQDTTELDYHGQDIEGLGPLSYEAQRGYFLHANICRDTRAGSSGGTGCLDVVTGIQRRGGAAGWSAGKYPLGRE